MIKKKATKKVTGQKSAKKSAHKKLKKEINPAEVRKQVSQIVQSEAASMTQAVIEEGKKGRVAPVKYLFEIANIFPAHTDPEHATEEEDCLAKILLSRMEAPAKSEKEEDDEPADAEAEVRKPEATPPPGNSEGTQNKEGALPTIGSATLVT